MVRAAIAMSVSVQDKGFVRMISRVCNLYHLAAVAGTLAVASVLGGCVGISGYQTVMNR